MVRLFPRLDAIAGRSREFLDRSLLARALEGLSLPLPPAPADLELLRAVVYGVACASVLGISTRLSLITLAATNLYLGAAVNSWGYAAHSTALPALLLVIVAAAPGVTEFSCDALFEVWRARRRGEDARFRDRVFGGADERLAGPAHVAAALPLLLRFRCRKASPQRPALDRRPYARVLLGRRIAAGGRGTSALSLRSRCAGERQVARWPRADRLRLPGRPTALGVSLSRSKTLVRLVSIATLLFELSFPLALLGRRITFGYLLFGTLFHLGIILMLQIEFWSFLVAYLLFVDWRALGGWMKRPASA